MHTDVCNQNFSLFLNLTMCDCMMKVQFAKHSLCVLGLGLLTLTQVIPNIGYHLHSSYSSRYIYSIHERSQTKSARIDGPICPLKTSQIKDLVYHT